SPDDLYSYDKKSNAIYKGILNLINFEKKGFLYWNNTNKLSLNSELEDHHIYPKKYLEKILADSDKDLIDCVLNRTLVLKLQNIKIRDQKPSQYLSEIKQKNPSLEKSLETHLLPPELIRGDYDNQYELFLKYRANEIFKIIQKTILEKREYQYLL
ncbi:MAG: hypothetical protein N3A69_14275, partial [Leptospiraceae bacterium]|nr:hypothetical protein [Leptospiraceae bacterium]